MSVGVDDVEYFEEGVLDVSDVVHRTFQVNISLLGIGFMCNHCYYLITERGPCSDCSGHVLTSSRTLPQLRDVHSHSLARSFQAESRSQYSPHSSCLLKAAASTNTWKFFCVLLSELRAV